MADGRLAVLLAHLSPEQHGASTQPGGRSEAPWFAASSGALVILGGVCLDIQAQPDSVDVQRGTSVPGQVRQVPGGVGRNMAEALSALLPPDLTAPVFVSLVGDDTAGAFLTASLRRLRLDLTQLTTCVGATTPCVSAVLDRGGEVAACVADVSAVERLLTPDRLSSCSSQIKQACMLLAEGNLSAEALQYVSRMAARARVPVFLEPVSVPKASRLVPALPYATFVSPNAAELMSIADEVRRRAGRPLLPRPVLGDDPEGGSRADSTHGSGDGEHSGSGGGRRSSEPVVDLLRQMAAFAEVVLAQGTSCVVLTLGSLGAALITFADADTAAGAPPRVPLEPLEMCSGEATAPVFHAGSCSSADCSGVGSSQSSGSADSCQQRAAAAAAPGLGQHPLEAIHTTRCTADDTTGLEGQVLGVSAGPEEGRPGVGWRGREAKATVALLRAAPTSVGGAAGGALDAVGESSASAPSPSPRQTAALQPQAQHNPLLQVLHLRALPAEVVSVNGAGDTLVAGMVAALLQRQHPLRALAYGMAAAKRAVESHRNVPDLDYSALRQDAEVVVATLQRHFFPSALADGSHLSPELSV